MIRLFTTHTLAKRQRVAGFGGFLLSLFVAATATAVIQHRPAWAAAPTSRNHTSQSKHGAAKPEHKLASEAFVIYVNRRDPWGRVYLSEDPDLLNWTDKSKAEIDRCFCEIKRKAPGLIARACNGEKIHVVLGTGDEDEAMDTTSARIKVNKAILSHEPGADRADEHEFILETLAHELVHFADCGNAISSQAEWNRMIAKALVEYRNKFPDSDALEDDRQFARASKILERLHLPSDYTAQNSTEALAEIAAAMAIADFKPDPAVAEFVNKNILSQPSGVNAEFALSRHALRLLDAGHPREAIKLATQMLRLDPQSLDAHWLLGRAWDDLNEPELAQSEWTQALNIAKRNRVPEFADDVITLHENISLLKLLRRN